ncbi:hypothetical protein [uncultured Jannaschia sp.]|uniref:hypothetical protein n=1 Tax=uncultured Jannaschia sp. TaxID=293347 RepID=UPI00260DE669|nr:hypothetical protein [uncultured Jannaschia sp.]
MPDPTPLISDAMLREFSELDGPAALGAFDEETRAVLSVALPEICLELLRRRAADRAPRINEVIDLRTCRPIREPATEPVAPLDEIAAARAALRAPFTPEADLRAAARTLRALSPHPDDQMTATRILRRAECMA